MPGNRKRSVWERLLPAKSREPRSHWDSGLTKPRLDLILIRDSRVTRCYSSIVSLRKYSTSKDQSCSPPPATAAAVAQTSASALAENHRGGKKVNYLLLRGNPSMQWPNTVQFYRLVDSILQMWFGLYCSFEGKLYTWAPILFSRTCLCESWECPVTCAKSVLYEDKCAGFIAFRLLYALKHRDWITSFTRLQVQLTAYNGVVKKTKETSNLQKYLGPVYVTPKTVLRCFVFALISPEWIVHLWQSELNRRQGPIWTDSTAGMSTCHPRWSTTWLTTLTVAAPPSW